MRPRNRTIERRRQSTDRDPRTVGELLGQALAGPLPWPRSVHRAGASPGADGWRRCHSLTRCPAAVVLLAALPAVLLVLVLAALLRPCPAAWGGPCWLPWRVGWAGVLAGSLAVVLLEVEGATGGRARGGLIRYLLRTSPQTFEGLPLGSPARSPNEAEQAVQNDV